MDESMEKSESGDAVIIVENEAESMPVPKETTTKRQRTMNLLDTCPECKLNFHSREPKLLPCLHSFCKKCLPLPSRSLVMPEQTGHLQVDTATKPLNVIRCPVCRQECMEVDVMENFFVKDSVEIPSSTVVKNIQLCMSCDDNTEATGFCQECVEFLCVTCIEAHQRVKFTKDHSIRQKEEVSEAVGISTQKPVFCDIHKQEPLKLFCETCDRLTCRDCQLLKHKDHNYQFLEDAYRHHREHMEDMTRQLQEKKRAIEEVSNFINNGLLQIDENRISVHNEIKKSICSLILEINRKGKILVNQLEALTKDNEIGLRKQQEDIGSLSRHLDHVINFTKWATGRRSGTALLCCKRLILFQIRNLLRAKCSTSFVPQCTVHFQCRSGFWASNIDLGSLVVENVPSPQMSGFQGPSYQLGQPGQGLDGSPSSLALGPSQQRLPPHSTLAQLQLQVEKLSQQPLRQPPPPPHWTWYQNVRLPRPPSTPLQGGSPSQNLPPMALQGRRFMAPHPNHLSPTSSLQGPAFTTQGLQTLRGVKSSSFPPEHMDIFQDPPRYSPNAPLHSSGSHSSPHSLQQLNMMESVYLSKRNNDPAGSLQILRPNFPLPASIPDRSAQGKPNPAMFSANSPEEKTVSLSRKPLEPQANGPPSLASKRRRRSSPGPIIIIKDEPEDDDDISYCQMRSRARASLPDSTGDQGHAPNDSTVDQTSTLHQNTGVQTVPPQESTGDNAQAPQQTTNSHSHRPQVSARDQSQTPQQSSGDQSHTQTHTGDQSHTQTRTGDQSHTQTHTGDQSHTQTRTGDQYHTQTHTGDQSHTQTRTGDQSHTQTRTGDQSHNQTGTGDQSHNQTHTGDQSHNQTRTGDQSHNQTRTGYQSHTQTHTGDQSHTQTRTGDQSHTQTRTGDQSHTQTRTGDQSHTQTRTGDQSHTQTRTGDQSHTQTHTGDQSHTQTHTGDQSHTQTRTGNQCQSPQRSAKEPAQNPNQSSGVQLSSEQEMGVHPALQDHPNEDRCAVCQNGGELLSCEKCPKVFHLNCHVPSLLRSPGGKWLCSLCRHLSKPEMVYDCDNRPEAKEVKEDPDSGVLSPVDKRKCERLLLRIYCSEFSSDFQEPISGSSMPEYYESIKTPMDLSVVKRKLDSRQSPCYGSPAEFVSDVQLIFRNCAMFYGADTDVAVAGKNLERYFEEQQKIFPEVKSEVVNAVTAPVCSPPAAAGEVSPSAKRPCWASEAPQRCTHPSTPGRGSS